MIADKFTKVHGLLSDNLRDIVINVSKVGELTCLEQFHLLDDAFKVSSFHRLTDRQLSQIGGRQQLVSKRQLDGLEIAKKKAET